MIGYFDSGYGGLTVLRAVQKKLPHLSSLYFGDNARAPYGALDSEVIYNYTKAGVHFLRDQGANLIILACNTASVHALRRLQHEIKDDPNWKNKNILGITVPTVEKILEKSPPHSKIAIIGTKAMIHSHFYKEMLQEVRPDLQIIEKACPLLVPLIEEAFHDKMECHRILKHYLRPLKANTVDMLVPACTHYPLLMNKIVKIMGKNCLVMDPCENLAEKLAHYLAQHPEIHMDTQKQEIYFTSGDASSFEKQARLFLQKNIQVSHIKV